MGRRWTHEVSAAWLEERRKVLTASDVKGLLAEYKRIQKKPLEPDAVAPGFAGLWGEKHSTMEVDTSSPSSAAARGHYMEPYAIEAWNANCGVPMFHWDDCIIANDRIGFSPDGMSIPMPCSAPRMNVKEGKFLCIENIKVAAPDEIVEVKSYEPKSHYKSLIKGHMDHDELWQLAMAFAVLPTLEQAHLMFFCPPTEHPIHVETYTREELSDHISMIVRIIDEYVRTDRLLSAKKSTWDVRFTEDEVWRDFIKEQEAEHGFKIK